MSTLKTFLALACMTFAGAVIAQDVEADKPVAKATYVGVLSVTAESQEQDGQAGYAVTQGDETRWVAKAEFERTYFLISDGTGEDAGLITEDTVERFITGHDTKEVGNRTAVSAAKTVIGFDVIETASVAETYAYESDKAKGIAERKADAMIWTFIGFVKQWADNGIQESKPSIGDEASVNRIDMMESVIKRLRFIKQSDHNFRRRHGWRATGLA